MRTYGTIVAILVVGCAMLPNLAAAQVRYRATVLADLEAQAKGQQSVATALNDFGAAVGFSEDDAQSQSAIGWVNAGANALIPGRSSTAFGVNNKLEVVGTLFNAPDQPPSQSAFLLRQGELFMLGDFPGGQDASSAFDINEAGQIVGIGCTQQGCVAFLWERGQMESLGDLPGGPVSSAAFAINDRGEVVGDSAGTKRGLTPVFWQGGKLVELPTLPARFPGGTAADINNQGQIVGSVFEGPVINNSRAVLWQEGELVPLPLLPGYAGSHASAINELGSIVGGSFDAAGQERAVLWQSGSMMDLNELLDEDQAAFLQLTDARDINELGQIVAQGLDLRREPAAPCAVLLTPVQE